MHCPTCGANASTGQKFCRACGMDLWVISQMVVKHLSGIDPALLPVEKDASKVARITILFSGIASFIIGLALLTAGQEPDWIGPIGILLLLTGTLLAPYGVLSPRWQIKRDLRAPLSRPATLPPGESKGWASAKAHDHDSIDSPS